MNEEYTTPELIELPPLTDVTVYRVSQAIGPLRQTLQRSKARVVRAPGEHANSSWNYKAEGAAIRTLAQWRRF